MTLWNPVYRIKVNGYTVTGATLAGMTITSGRTDIYSQPAAGYARLSLLETSLAAVPYEINDPLSIEVKDSTNTYVPIFGGFLTDISIQVTQSGTSATVQNINLLATGALARLNRATFIGNLAHNFDGDMIYEVISTVLFDSWDEVPAATTWATYDPLVQWEDAQNNGLGEIDRPGDYELHSQSSLTENVYSLASRLATSGLGYLYEDAQGRIGYADSTHRSQYLSDEGYVDLDARQAIAPGLDIVKRAGDVRNEITVQYGATSQNSHTETDLASATLYGRLASTVQTILRHQHDAEDQALFYLDIRAYPQFQFEQITYELGSPELDDSDRDNLINVFMGEALNIQNLPSNMVNAEFQGFVEGWTWRAAFNRLTLTMTLSPISYSLQAFRWNSVPSTETYNTISPTLTWLDATIVA